MTRRLLLMLLLFFAALPALADHGYTGTMNGKDKRPYDVIYHQFTLDATTNATRAFELGTSCSVTFIDGAGGDVALHECPASTTAIGSCDAAETTFTASTTVPFVFDPGKGFGRLAPASSASGAVVTITCAGGIAGGGGGGVEVIENAALASPGEQDVIYQVTNATDGTDCAVGTSGTETAFCGWDGAAYIPVGVASAGDEMDAAQSVPSAGEYYGRSRGTITDPASVNFGYGIAFGSVSAFTSESYPGSGVNVNEPDNLFGPYYNGNPCSAVRLNAQEHAFEDCYEFNYRETAGTASDTWIEENLDVTSPDVTIGFTGITGTPVAGNYAVFSGGATCKIIAWSSPNLQCRMSYGVTAAAQTATWSGGGGTVSTIAAVNNADTSWRPRHMVWDTMDQIAEFGWYSDEASGLPYMLMRNGEIRMGTNDNPAAQLLVGAPGGISSIQTIGAIDLGYEAVRLTPGTATSGEFTIAGRGTGTDESLTFNFNTANTVNVTSSTGVTTINFPDGSIPAADIAGGAAGDSVLIGGDPVTGSSIDFTPDVGIAITPDTSPPTSAGFGLDLTYDYGTSMPNTAENCFLTTTGTNGAAGVGFGGFICEGATANGFEHKFTFSPFTETVDAEKFIPLAPFGVIFAGNTATRTVTLPDTNFTVPQKIAASTATLATAEIASGSCATVVTATATGAASSDVLSWSFNTDVSGITGFDPVTTGGLSIYAYPGTNAANFKVCNPTASAITPSSAVTLNWNIIR